MLDFIGAYDALRRVAAMSIDREVTHRVVIGTDAEIVDETGLKITPGSVYEDTLAVRPAYLGRARHRHADGQQVAIGYLKTWGDERPLASVCSGAFLLGHAGYLRDKRATTHHQAVDFLRPLCREVVTNRRGRRETHLHGGRRLVRARPGLYLVEKFWGADARAAIARQIEYRGYSPA